MQNIQCDRCDYITQTEDDHAVTKDGEYLCYKCLRERQPWGYKRLSKLALEYDGSIVMGNQVVGKMAPDYFTPQEVNDVCKEIVRRWNSFETDLDKSISSKESSNEFKQKCKAEIFDNELDKPICVSGKTLVVEENDFIEVGIRSEDSNSTWLITKKEAISLKKVLDYLLDV
jgi:hypothetical protein